MALTSWSASPGSVNPLVQSARPVRLEPSVRLLLAALEQGWRIEPPVYVRACQDTPDKLAYHFSLRHSKHAERLLAVAVGPEAERFLRTNGLSPAD